MDSAELNETPEHRNQRVGQKTELPNRSAPGWGLIGKRSSQGNRLRAGVAARSWRCSAGSVRDWFRAVLKSQVKDSLQESLSKWAELVRQSSLAFALDKLFNMQLTD